jgi:hypothetical protein
MDVIASRLVQAMRRHTVVRQFEFECEVAISGYRSRAVRLISLRFIELPSNLHVF